MLLSPEVRRTVQARLQAMHGPVRLVHFTQTGESPSRPQATQLLQEVAQLSPRLSLTVCDLDANRAQAARYGIAHDAATVIEGTRDYGIRIYGLPTGYEFAVLIETILLVSTGRSALPPQIRSSLALLSAPVHLQTFSTPTCPYCPSMAILAHQMAMESELVRADLLDATEYPELVRAHNVRGVPMTLINGAASIEGTVAAEDLVAAILQAAAPKKSIAHV